MSGYAVVSIALRPPRKCSTLGDGIVIFGVAFVVFFRNLKSSTKIGCGRDSLPVIFTPGGVHSILPWGERNLIGDRRGIPKRTVAHGRRVRLRERREDAGDSEQGTIAKVRDRMDSAKSADHR